PASSPASSGIGPRRVGRNWLCRFSSISSPKALTVDGFYYARAWDTFSSVHQRQGDCAFLQIVIDHISVSILLPNPLHLFGQFLKPSSIHIPRISNGVMGFIH